MGFDTLIGNTDNSLLTVTDSTLEQNTAQGGNGHGAGNGGAGQGGGLAIQSGSSGTLAASTITQNHAVGGAGGSHGHNGSGVGGGVNALGTFAFDAATVIDQNHASTSNNDVFT